MGPQREPRQVHACAVTTQSPRYIRLTSGSCFRNSASLHTNSATTQNSSEGGGRTREPGMRLATCHVVGLQGVLEKPVRSGQGGGGRAAQGFGPRPRALAPPTEPRLKPQSKSAWLQGPRGQPGRGRHAGPRVCRETRGGTRATSPQDQWETSVLWGPPAAHPGGGRRRHNTGPARVGAVTPPPRGPWTRKGHGHGRATEGPPDYRSPRTGHSRNRPTSPHSGPRCPPPLPHSNRGPRGQSTANCSRRVLYRSQQPLGPPLGDEAKARLCRTDCGAWPLPQAAHPPGAGLRGSCATAPCPLCATFPKQRMKRREGGQCPPPPSAVLRPAGPVCGGWAGLGLGHPRRLPAHRGRGQGGCPGTAGTGTARTAPGRDSSWARGGQWPRGAGG